MEDGNLRLPAISLNRWTNPKDLHRNYSFFILHHSFFICYKAKGRECSRPSVIFRLSDFCAVTSTGDLGDHGDGVVVAQKLEGLLGGLEVDDTQLAVLLEGCVVLVNGGGVGGEHIGLADTLSLQLGIGLGGAGGDLAEVLDGDLQDLLALHAAVDAGEGHLASDHGVLQLAVEDLPKVEDQAQKTQGEDGENEDGAEGDDDPDGDEGQEGEASPELEGFTLSLGALVHDELKGVEIAHDDVPLLMMICWVYYTTFRLGLQGEKPFFVKIFFARPNERGS